jgi:amino acid adenylation domain-containing protein
MSSRKSVPSAFEEQRRKAPDRVALLQADRRLTYDELGRASERVARALLARGLEPEECVGVSSGRSLEMVVASLGISKAGGCYVPIDSALPSTRRRFFCEDARLRFLLYDEATESAEPELGSAVETLSIQALLRTSIDDASELPPIGPERLCYVMYTSGSTGTPKGVMIEHRAVLNLVTRPAYLAWVPDDRLLMTGAIGFDLTTMEIWGSLLNGLCLCLVSNETLLEPRALKAALETHSVTSLMLATSLCHRLLEEDPSAFASLKSLLIGGDTLLPRVMNPLRKRCPALRVLNGYGPTENTTFSTVHQLEGEYARSIPIGRPIAGTGAFVLDDALQPIEDGRSGDLVVLGANLARGYLNQPQLTRERFVEHPTLGRIYRTGDRARWDSAGNLEFLGRQDRQVKLGGYRVELGEVEASLRAVGGIADGVCKVCSVAGERMLAAYYVASNPALDPLTVTRRLRAELPSYALPAFVTRLDALPLDSRGKFDTRALPDPVASGTAGKPSAEGLDAQGIQQLVARLWADVLQRDSVDPHADFQSLGGDSIRAMHLLGRMTSAGLDLSLSDIFHYKSVAALSEYLSALRNASGRSHDSQEPNERWVAKLGGQFTLSRFALIEPGQEPRRFTLLTCRDTSTDREALLRNIARIAPLESQPHYLLLGQSADAVPNSGNAADLARVASLSDARGMDLEQLKLLLSRASEYNQRTFDRLPVVKDIPFSAIQELQYSFRTPMSFAFVPLDHYVDPSLLERALATLVNEQELLRSVPIEVDGRHYFREHDARAASLRIPMIDLSGCYLPERELFEVVRAVLAGRELRGPRLLYQLSLLRRNAREHALLLVFHHVLFDRVSEEIIKRELLSRYAALVAGTTPAQSSATPFSVYVARLRHGPEHIVPAEIIRRFELRGFLESKRRILSSPRLEKDSRSYSFEIAVPYAGHSERGDSVGAALAIYVRAVRAIYGIDQVPVLFIYDGRRYAGEDYYGIVGELIDYVPLLIDARLSVAEIQSTVSERLRLVNHHGINFLSLIDDGRFHERWREVGDLIQLGPAYETTDFFMFNYLGNQPAQLSFRERHQTEVQITANPLPIHSLLNCITCGYSDGFVFSIRSSFVTDVEALRRTFASAELD